MMQNGGVGVGYSNRPEAFQAGKEAASLAVARGRIQEASLVLAFCTSSTDFDAFFAGVRATVGSQPPIVGGAAIGIITLENLCYTGSPTAVAVFDSTVLQAQTTWASQVDKDPAGAGSALRAGLDCSAACKAVLMFYESIQTPPTSESPPVIVPSGELLRGFGHSMPGTPPIYGAGLMGDYAFHRSKQFCGDSVRECAVTATSLTSEVEIYSTITHGCSLLDGIYRTITKIDGPILYELDGQPVVNVIDDLYGNTSWRLERPVATLTLGMPQSGRYVDFNEQDYVNRLISGPLPDSSGIVLFESGPNVGDTVQFLYRDPIKMVDSASANTRKLLSDLDARNLQPLFAMYIDCAGRTATASLTRTEEAGEVQCALKAREIPLLGIYSGVELAPICGQTRGLDWTGVLLLLAQRR